jgi:hypothetical protein
MGTLMFPLGLINRCANPQCSSGWLHVFRKRSVPIFEGGWTCSPECTESRVLSAVRREQDGRSSARKVRRHRIPLGLLMLEKGWINQEQLRKALEAQRSYRKARVGEWLVEQGATDEETVTRALGLQWSCPVLSPEPGISEISGSIIPRILIEVTRALPLRVAAGKILYLGFEESLDTMLALAVERITGLHVESGVVASRGFKKSFQEALRGRFAPLRLVEAASEVAAARLMAKAVERAQPLGARLVRIHDFLWMRMTLPQSPRHVSDISSLSDVICMVRKP